jgi:hypothetical protein
VLQLDVAYLAGLVTVVNGSVVELWEVSLVSVASVSWGFVS